MAECDLTGETPALVRSYLWDPSEPEATRVLAMTRWEANGTQVKEHLYCMHDAMKNVTSLFGEARGRRALYEYRPYGGLVTSEGNMAQENKFPLLVRIHGRRARPHLLQLPASQSARRQMKSAAIPIKEEGG